MGVSWRKSGTSSDIFTAVWEGYCVTGTNFSLLMRNSRVRSMACLTLPPSWPVYLPDHWRVFRSYFENREWGRWEWTSADGWFTQSLSWWQIGLLVSLPINVRDQVWDNNWLANVCLCERGGEVSVIVSARLLPRHRWGIDYILDNDGL